MLVKDFSYDLPEELIARRPASERDSSRLMLLDRKSGGISGDVFRNLLNYLEPGDLLVLNDTRVIPARIAGRKVSGGKVEIFLVRRVSGDPEHWLCLLRGSKRFNGGESVLLASGMIATVIEKNDGELWLVGFTGVEPFAAWLEREGHVPLPPYLQRPDDQLDRERYQTVYASVPGAVAAPTAGLHFTPGLLAALEKKGVESVYLTLHTGVGTFQPVRVERVEEHRIHSESFFLSAAAADAVNSAKRRGSRVIAVGTTSARTLEYCADACGRVIQQDGEADIFIYPGYSFKVVDALITNFHLPESTLLMLVAAFAGLDHALDAYREAVRLGYRFYSYGDAMLIK